MGRGKVRGAIGFGFAALVLALFSDAFAGDAGAPALPLVATPSATASSSAAPSGSSQAAAPSASGSAAFAQHGALLPAAEGEGEDERPTTPPPAPSPTPKAGPKAPTIVKNGMVRILASRFTMGSADRATPPNEHPVRVVVVPTFWIDKTEVTVGAYRACVDRGTCQKPPHGSAQCTFDTGDPQLPVSCVPWSAAQAYCIAVGKRLPREAEWELAARGTQAIRYPWGGTGTSCGMAATLTRENTNRTCSGKHPSHVGAHLAGASPFGVLDMSGNVEEWVADWYGENVSELSPRAGSSHVLRGGGYLSPPSLARTTTRNWGSVLEAGPNVGFRCARDDRPFEDGAKD